MFYEKDIDSDLIEKSWKLVSSQSERQLGAFIFLYVSEFKKLPHVWGRNWAEFRNDVIHKGRIPSRKEAIEYGEQILKIARSLVAQGREKYPKGIHAAMFRHMRSLHKNSSELAATISIPTIISLVDRGKEYDERTLEEVVRELRKW